MLTKSLGPSVSKMVLMVCRAIFRFWPIIEPELSTNMIMSFGSVAASMYQGRCRASKSVSWLSSVHSTPVEGTERINE